MSGIEKFTPDNHALWRRFQHLVRLKWGWDAIADDLGLVGSRRVQDLAEWALEYRSPKADTRPMVNSMVLNVPVRSKELLDRGVRLQTQSWRRETQGARKTLEALGK